MVFPNRFNSAKDIADSGVAAGQKVFMAPRTEHTAFVFLGQLLKLKGTDASWKGDEEVPSKFQVRSKVTQSGLPDGKILSLPFLGLCQGGGRAGAIQGKEGIKFCSVA